MRGSVYYVGNQMTGLAASGADHLVFKMSMLVLIVKMCNPNFSCHIIHTDFSPLADNKTLILHARCAR